MELTTLSVESREHVLSLGLNRPAKRNAFTLEMLSELSKAYTHLERDPDLRCLALFAHGEHFTAGLDLAEVGPAVAQGQALFPPGAVDPLDLFGPRREKPVVCGVMGYCFTIGIELLLAADIRIAADNTVFAQMEVQRGIMAFGGATLRMPQIAGFGNAMRWLLTGERFGAQEALRIGLVQEVVPAQAVRARTDELARLVAAQAPLAVQATRRAAQIAVEEGAAQARAALLGEARRLMATEDAALGLRSFVERKPARFLGK